jgi:lipoprotein-anchoring transpeptidase ErfK/SrfK
VFVTIHRRAVVLGAAAVVLAMVAAGCSAKRTSARTAPSEGSSPAAVSVPGTSSGAVTPAVVTVNPANGAASVSPAAPITVRVDGGSLSVVTLTNAEGKAVKGALSADKLSWSAAEPLGYGKSYTLIATATNSAGTQTTQTSSFTTVSPNNLTMPYIQTAAGGAINPGVTFGVGQVVRIHFDEQIPDKKAAEQALSVITAPAQVGAFNWFNNQDVYWRTKTYLKPGTKVTITAKAYGRDFGTGLYGQDDATTWFRVGAKHISIADDSTKLISVYSNDKLVKTMPTSMGRHTSITGDNGQQIDLRTNSGPHVVVGGETNITMNSGSFGVDPKTNPNGYKVTIPVGVRISYDGEYVHWADWSLWAQGNTDTSHGCLNVSPDNSWWFYKFSRPGDIVDVRNTGRKLALWNSGYWNESWTVWAAGSALK